jgi:hypothetical protein
MFNLAALWNRETFGRHFVGLHITLTREADQKGFVFSGFVFTAHERYFWVSAGHILEGINGHIDEGWRLDDAYLLDLGKQYGHPIPFRYDRQQVLAICEDKVDVGFFELEGLYVQALLSNGLIPIELPYVASSDSEWEHYFAIGTPTEFTRFYGTDKEHVECSPIPIYLKRLEDERVVGQGLRLCFGLTENNVSSGGERMTNMDGMSGGPVFCTSYDAENGHRYKVIGIQSAWLPSKQVSLVCPFDRVAAILEMAAAGTLEAFVNEAR